MKNPGDRWWLPLVAGSIQCIPFFHGVQGSGWNLVKPKWCRASLLFWGGATETLSFWQQGGCFCFCFFFRMVCCGEVRKWDFLRWFRKHSEWKHFKKENSRFLMLHDHPSTLIKHRWISKNRNGFNIGQNLQWFLLIDIVLGSRMTP